MQLLVVDVCNRPLTCLILLICPPFFPLTGICFNVNSALFDLKIKFSASSINFSGLKIKGQYRNERKKRVEIKTVLEGCKLFLWVPEGQTSDAQ